VVARFWGAGALCARHEVVRAARSAATFDPRYRPLRPDDLRDFAVTVSVVERQTPLSMSELATLSPEEGLVLQSGARFGIVLPFEGRDPRTRLGWAWKKAGVAPGSSCRLFRLQAQRFRG
jgi:AMMECR1 domain-containing protein